MYDRASKRGKKDSMVEDERGLRKKFKYVRKNYELYLFLLPVIIHLVTFSYYTMYGVQIAFRDYNPVQGFWNSPWVGLKHMERFTNSPYFLQTLKNTLTISIYSMAVGFPIPLIMALALNMMANKKYQRFVQTVLYAPNFISTVVIVGMIFIFFSPYNGPVNAVLRSIGKQTINFMGLPKLFSHVYVWSGIWQNAGWGMVIYLAALSGVSPELHEAAIIDGATKLQRVINVDIPSIMPTVTILLILNLGSLIGVGFEKVYLMQNPLNSGVSEVISTYVYKRGLNGGEFSFASAVGLMNTVANLILLLVVNSISRRVSEHSLW
jgi:putative aldouronate transport system permease protein